MASKAVLLEDGGDVRGEIDRLIRSSPSRPNSQECGECSEWNEKSLSGHMHVHVAVGAGGNQFSSDSVSGCSPRSCSPTSTPGVGTGGRRAGFGWRRRVRSIPKPQQNIIIQATDAMRWKPTRFTASPWGRSSMRGGCALFRQAVMAWHPGGSVRTRPGIWRRCPTLHAACRCLERGVGRFVRCW